MLFNLKQNVDVNFGPTLPELEEAGVEIEEKVGFIKDFLSIVKEEADASVFGK